MHLSTLCHFLTDWRGRPSSFSDRPEKTTNLVKDVEILLCVKFSCILLSGFRGDVKNFSATQTPEWPSSFSYLTPPPPKKKPVNLVKDVEILLHAKCRWIPFISYRGEFGNVSVNQKVRAAISFFDRPEKKNKLERGYLDLASYQVSLNSVQRFQRRSWKCLSQSEARAANFFWSAQTNKLGSKISIFSYTMLFPPVIHNFRYKTRVEHGNE